MEERDVPIDINTGKLLDWLINRRHCTRNWQSNILTIRTKINNAIRDMPADDEIAKLLTGTHINYFHCKKIVEILRKTEANSKNVFGQYSSQRMKDWQEIVRLYEHDNVYLAEAAQMLTRNINYEVPGFKKRIQKFEQTGHELEKKETELKKSANIVRNEFTNLCKKMGITGKNIKRELVERIDELPASYEEILKKVKNLNNVVEFYSAFVELTLGRQHDNGCVPMVQYVLDKGNTTTYEWTYGEPPLSIVEPKLNVNYDDDKMNADAQNDIEIDFGGIDDVAEINFDENITVENNDSINWDDMDVRDEESGDIDFNIALEESGIVVEAAGHEGGIATDNEALTIMDNPITRRDFIDQLLELESFLKLRLYEFKSDGSNNVLSMSQLQGGSSILQLATLDWTQNMLDKVQIVLTDMMDSRVQHLHHMKHSPKYLDVLTNTIEQKLAVIDKMVLMQQAVKAKRDDITEQGLALQPILKLVIQRTRELQNDVEADISKKYKNRLVRLSGGVNTL